MHHQERSGQTAPPSCWLLPTAKRPTSPSPADGTDIYFIKNKRQPSRVFRDPILSRPDRIGSLKSSKCSFSPSHSYEPDDDMPTPRCDPTPDGHQTPKRELPIIVRPVDRYRTCVSDLERTGALHCEPRRNKPAGRRPLFPSLTELRHWTRFEQDGRRERNEWDGEAW